MSDQLDQIDNQECFYDRAFPDTGKLMQAGQSQYERNRRLRGIRDQLHC